MSPKSFTPPSASDKKLLKSSQSLLKKLQSALDPIQSRNVVLTQKDAAIIRRLIKKLEKILSDSKVVSEK